ncbi:MAG TPA: hypothetical protein VHE35_12285, partial [Kofleriaceae bacterium]|nr:hypothetical protein [Kofleriaceae bacterium]
MRTTPARLVIGGLAAAFAAIASAACGGPMTQLRSDNHELTGDVDHLRAELRSERRQRQDLENQVLVLKDQLETSKVNAATTAPPTLPVEVLAPSDVPENGQLVGVTDDGQQIVYVDDANKPPVEIDPDDVSTTPPAPRARPHRHAPAPAAPSGSAGDDADDAADLDDLPSAADLEAGV